MNTAEQHVKSLENLRIFSRGAVRPHTTHVGMCHPKGYVSLRRFCLKTGIDFAHFALESGMVFEGTTKVYDRIYSFNSK